MLAFIKKNPEAPLEDVKSSGHSISSQVQLVNLSEGSPFETLHSYIHNSFSPFFWSFVKRERKSEKEAKAGGALNAIGQKLADLEVSLFNVKQNVQIEEVLLEFHPDIADAGRKAKQANRTLRPEDIGEKSKETEFLNAIQGGVNNWIKNIQKVTKLERIETMPQSGDTIGEVKFWLELEGELTHIDVQLHSPEAECTLNTLKQAKRFHATVAFDSDTIGLRKAIEKVQNYKPLMKEFPISDLLSANEIDKLADAIVKIFNHLKKNKNVNYPIPRYLRLVEAVSRDMCIKLLNILHAKVRIGSSLGPNDLTLPPPLASLEPRV